MISWFLNLYAAVLPLRDAAGLPASEEIPMEFWISTFVTS
jgi:hypothetical protein